MTSIDIAALGAAPVAADAMGTPAGTGDIASDFAAILDEAAGAADPAADRPSASGASDDDDRDIVDDLAAMMMTNLLSLVAPIAAPEKAIADGSADAAREIGDVLTMREVTAPDASIDIEAPGDESQTAADGSAEGATEALSPPWNRNARAAAAANRTMVGSDDATLQTVTEPQAVPAAGENAAATPHVGENTAATSHVGEARDEAATPARAETTSAPPVKSSREVKASRVEHDASITPAAGAADTVAPTGATAISGRAIAEPRAATPEISTGTEPPASTAARLARALERAASLALDSAGAAQPPASTNSSGGHSSSPFGGDGSTEHDAQPAAAPRHAGGVLSFTMAAPAALDARALARAVDAASHSFDTATAPNPEPDVVAQLVQSMRVQFRDGIGEAVLKLKPEHLGSVQIALTMENGAIKATVQADVASVRQWLESHQETLRTGLAEHGLRLERFVVEPDGQRRSPRDDAQPREQRRRQRQRQMSGTDHPVFDVTV